MQVHTLFTQNYHEAISCIFIHPGREYKRAVVVVIKRGSILIWAFKDLNFLNNNNLMEQMRLLGCH